MQYCDFKFLDLSQIDKRLLADVINLDSEMMDFPWTDQQWMSLDHNLYRLYVAMSQGEVVGFILFQCLPGDAQTHLLKIALALGHQKKGLAVKMFKTAIDKLYHEGYKEVYLEVSQMNLAAVKLYQKLDFKVINEMKNYYSNGDAAYAMQCCLDKSLQ